MTSRRGILMQTLCKALAENQDGTLALHAGRSTRAAPREVIHAGGRKSSYTDVRSILMGLWRVSKVHCNARTVAWHNQRVLAHDLGKEQPDHCNGDRVARKGREQMRAILVGKMIIK